LLICNNFSHFFWGRKHAKWLFYFYCGNLQIYFSTKGLGLWCLTPLSTIFQLYGDGQFYWWRKPEYLEKTTELPGGGGGGALAARPH
jgi:hypothetical protein